jgi:hypothetical protein
MGEFYVLEDRQPSLWGDKFIQQGNSTKGLENNFHYERKQKLYNMCQKLMLS